MSIVISVENVSKSYRLGMIGGGTLKEDFARWCAKVRGKPDPLLKIGEEHGTRRIGEQFWALENVSFEVKESEVLGIIGRNGAGKSTLLKILSQVTAPTSGQVKVKGRIGSLLEVGTGFHPELTGRENIFLNGAILGMTKAEIRGKLDEIIAFSGIEEFIDTPVKRYSSGMYVRLAFAVAAHLEPEILIIDEVLAVGDAAFQKRCLGKMGDVAKEGRTVLLVSHNLVAVQGLCRKTILLRDGTIEYRGETKKAIELYQNGIKLYSNAPIRERTDREGDGSVKVLDLWLENNGCERVQKVGTGEKMSISLSYQASKAYRSLTFLVSIYNEHNQRVLNFDSDLNSGAPDYWPEAAVVKWTISIPFPLSPAQYRANAAVFATNALADHVPDAMQFEVIAADFFGAGRLNRNMPMFIVPSELSLKK